MTEITRVPLQPIAKGALTKLWLGVAAVFLAAAGLAWATLPGSVKIETLKAGTGASPTLEDVVLVKMKGTLASGKVFQPEGQGPLEMSGVIPGFAQALQKMQKGGKYKVEIPSELGYGAEDQRNPQTGAVEIPGGSDLTFDIELIDFKNRAELQAQMQAMQQLQQMQQQGGAPGGPPPGAPLPPQPKQ